MSNLCSYPVEKSEDGELKSLLVVNEGMNKLQKNVDYLKEKNQLDMIQKGGKMHKSFVDLQNKVLYDVLQYVYEETVEGLAFYNVELSKAMFKQALEMEEVVVPSLIKAIKNIDIEAIQKVAMELKTDYANLYLKKIQEDSDYFYNRKSA